MISSRSGLKVKLDKTGTPTWSQKENTQPGMDAEKYVKVRYLENFFNKIGIFFEKNWKFSL